MVAISLRLWIMLETAIYLSLGRQVFDLDWTGALFGALCGLLGSRAGINATTWIFSLAYASPGTPLSLSRRLGIILDEYIVFLYTFLLVIPFESLWMPADRLRHGQPTILLVHGYGVSRGIWWLFRRRLEAAGYNVASLSLVPPLASLDDMVPQLAQRIAAVCTELGSPQISLLGHSMGGLVCRAYLARHGSSKVSQLITLASPHHGTELARLGRGLNSRQMEPGSDWLGTLAQSRIACPVNCLCNPCDNYSMPQDTQRLAGAENSEIPPAGHLAMLNKPWLADRVIATCQHRGT